MSIDSTGFMCLQLGCRWGGWVSASAVVGCESDFSSRILYQHFRRTIFAVFIVNTSRLDNLILHQCHYASQRHLFSGQTSETPKACCKCSVLSWKFYFASSASLFYMYVHSRGFIRLQSICDAIVYWSLSRFNDVDIILCAKWSW